MCIVFIINLLPCIFGSRSSDKPGQAQSSYDMLEPLRPQIEKIIFKYAASRVFERELKEPRPHVRLGSKLAREAA